MCGYFLFHPHRFQIYTLVIAFLRAGGQRPSRPELQKTWLLLGLLLLVVPVDAAITCVKAGSTPGISQGKAAGFVTLRHLGCFFEQWIDISDISEHFARSSAGSNMSLFAAVHARYLSGFGHWHGALVLMMTIGTTEILNVVLIRRLLVVIMLNTLKGLHLQDGGAHMLPALAKRFYSNLGLSQYIPSISDYIFIYNL